MARFVITLAVFFSMSACIDADVLAEPSTCQRPGRAQESGTGPHSARHQGFGNQVFDQVSFAQRSLKLNSKRHRQQACQDIDGALPSVNSRCDHLMQQFIGAIESAHKKTTVLSALVFPASITCLPGFREFKTSLDIFAATTKHGSEALRGVVCAGGSASVFATALKTNFDQVEPALLDYTKRLFVDIMPAVNAEGPDFRQAFRTAFQLAYPDSEFPNLQGAFFAPFQFMVNYDSTLAEMVKSGEEEMSRPSVSIEDAGVEETTKNFIPCDTTGIEPIRRELAVQLQAINTATINWELLSQSLGLFANMFKAASLYREQPEQRALILRPGQFPALMNKLEAVLDKYKKELTPYKKDQNGQLHGGLTNTDQDGNPLDAAIAEGHCVVKELHRFSIGLNGARLASVSVGLNGAPRLLKCLEDKLNWNRLATRQLPGCGPEAQQALDAHMRTGADHPHTFG